MTEDKEKANMKTDVSILNTLSGPVFAEQFKAADKNPLSLAAYQIFKPEDFKVVHFYSFKSESELSGSSIAYEMKANAGKKESLLDGYGSFGKLNVGGFYRFKGKSSPYDSSVAYALKANAGKEGLTIDGYGPFGELSFAGFMQKAEKNQQII